MMDLTVASIQFDTSLGNVSHNWEKAEGFIRNVSKLGAKVVVLPELFNTGYRLDDLYQEFAETIPGPTVNRITALSVEENIYIVGCMVEKDTALGSIFDTSFLTGPEGLLGIYRKIHLWGREPEFFTPGSAFSVFEIPWGLVGMLICYDVGFPEAARSLALAGVDMILMPSAFGMPRLYAWELATRSRALENGCFLVTANRVGLEKDTQFCGHSRVVDPQGNVLVDAGLDETIITARIDLGEVKRQRERIPYLADRRPDAYRLIS